MNLEQKKPQQLLLLLLQKTIPVRKNEETSYIYHRFKKLNNIRKKILNMMEITTSRDQVVEEELSDQEEVRENVFFKGRRV